MSNTNKVILDRRGVKACGPLRAGVLYEISDSAEAERLVRVKKFRKATAEDEKRCTRKLPRPATYTVVRDDKPVEITATGYAEPEQPPAKGPVRSAPETSSKPAAGAKQEDK